LFSWVYIQEHLWSIQQNTKLESFFPGLICFDSRENQCATARYLQKLSKVINLRDLETDLIQGLGTGDNKLFVSNDFTYKQLYDLYAEKEEI
jgi:hypothetical protein